MTTRDAEEHARRCAGLVAKAYGLTGPGSYTPEEIHRLKRSMNALINMRIYLLVCSLVVILQPLCGLAQQNPKTSSDGPQPALAERDGGHDFDFAIGTWKTHLRRLQHPLSGPFNGRGIFVRFIVSDIKADSCRFEQSFSDDGGKTWEVNWIAIDERVKTESDKTP